MDLAYERRAWTLIYLCLGLVEGGTAAVMVRALFVAAESLEARARAARRTGNLPRNAGKTWTQEEDERLLAGFDGGTMVDALATAHERTRAGIEARLVKHGRLEAEQAPAARIR